MQQPYNRRFGRPFARHWRRLAVAAGLIPLLAPAASAQWVAQDTKFPNNSTGVNQVRAVDASNVWLNGFDGSGGGAVLRTFSRTTNGGTTWTTGTVPATAGLRWVDLSPVSGTTAWATFVDGTAGGGEIYKTTNGGTSWTRQLNTGFVGGYLDAIRMFSATSGIVVGDPVGGEFEVYTTTNGGTTWNPVAATALPDPLANEYVYLGVIQVQGTSNVWFATSMGRVFRSSNGGTTWNVSTTGQTDITALAFSSATQGLALETDPMTGAFMSLAGTTDGGQTWNPITPTGTVYTRDLAPVPGSPGTYLSAAPYTTIGAGSSFSTDGGLTWTDLETGVQRTAIGAANADNIWAGAYNVLTTNPTANTGGVFKGALPALPPPVGVAPDWVSAVGPAVSTTDDVAQSTTTDAAGNVYVTGRFTGTGTFGATTLTSAGANDGYVAKYSGSGALIWARRFGGTLEDSPRDVAVDGTGNVYVSGGVRGTAAFGTLNLTSTGDADAFIAKYDGAGTIQWVRGGGGTGADQANSLGVDGSGNLYVTGNVAAGSATFSGTAVTGPGGIDLFVASYDNSGALRWVRRAGGTGDDYGAGLGATSAGVVTIAGTFGVSNAGGTASFGATTITSAGGTDSYVASYTSAGTLRWVRAYGSTGDDGVNNLAIDGSGNAFAAGYFGGGLTLGGTTKTATSVFSILLASFDATGAPRWVQSGGGPTGDSGYNVATDNAGNAYLTGFYQGAANFGGVTLTNAGLADVLVAKYDGTTGDLSWITTATGTGSEYGRGLAVDGNDNVYVAGSFDSPILTFGNGVSRTPSGAIDGYLAKLGSACTLTTPTLTASATALCAGQALTFTSTNVAAGTSVTLTGPNGFSLITANGTIPSADVAASGTYTLTVTDDAQGCSTSATVTVTVSASPTAPTTTGASNCGPGTLTLTAAGAPTGATYQWYTTATGGSSISGATSATYTTPSLNATTTYYVSALIGTCESPRTAVTATVNPQASAAFAYASSTLCLSSPTSPTPAITGTAGGTFTATPAGLTLNATTGAVTLASSAQGTYTITYSVGGICPATATQTVTVTAAPSAAFTYAATPGLCAGGSATVTPTLGSGASGGVFSATPAGLMVDAVTGTVTLASSAAGTYTITNTIAASGSCTAVSASATLTVAAAPVATLTAGSTTTFCAGGAVTLTASGGGTYVFTLDGTPVTATGATLTATQSGVYAVTVTTAGGCSATSTPLTVTVNPLPTAPTTTSASRCDGGTVTLTAAGAPTGATYQWYTAATGGSPIAGATGATYTTPALGATTTYYVSALLGTCESSRTAVTATVNAAPTAALTAGGATTFCAGDNVILTATGSGTYQFALNGIPLVNATNATYTATQSGTYTVTVTSAAGCPTTSAPVAVTVNPIATAPTTTGASRCDGGTVTLTAAGAPTGATYQWYTAATGGSPIAGATGATYTTPALGATTTYYVSALLGTCESSRTAVTATVNAAPTAALTAGGATTFCAGSNVILTATGSGTYQFALNGIPLVNATNATYTATQAGTYTVTVTSAAGCPATSGPVAVTVNPVASATFTYPATTLCLSGAPTATPTISGTTGGTFSVSPATGLTVDPTTGVVTVTGGQPGTYAITYAVGGTCPATASQTVTVTAAPAAAFTYAQPAFCAGSAASAVVTLGTGAAAGTYSATPAGLTLNATTGAINLATSTAGTYTVSNSVAATGSCAAVVATTSVTLNAAPATPTITSQTLPSGIVTLTSSATTGNQWFLNGTLVAGATDPTLTLTSAAANGLYTVQVTGTGGCTSALSTGTQVTVVLGAPADLAAAGITLYPNPTADGRTMLELGTQTGTVACTLFDAAGRTVWQAALVGGGSHSLDLHQLPTGVYVLRAVTNGTVVTRRVVRN